MGSDETNGFMLEEYKQIVAANFNLSKQKTNMFQIYLALVTIPITLMAAILGFQKIDLALTSLPSIVTFTLFAVAVGGLIMAAVIIDIRWESILYAKTVNLARRFFAETSDKGYLQKYLLLPISDEYPKYYEQPWEFTKRKWKWDLGVGSTFLQVLLMGLLNGTYFGLAMTNLIGYSYSLDLSVWSGLILGIVFFTVHLWGYRYFGKKKDVQWKTRHPDKDL